MEHNTAAEQFVLNHVEIATLVFLAHDCVEKKTAIHAAVAEAIAVIVVIAAVLTVVVIAKKVMVAATVEAAAAASKKARRNSGKISVIRHQWI